ncbi:glycosyltransferase family 2 protein [Exiguobacterium sp. s7]|uniref:glycosyltransferase family 2 protein n=1 Tax=Exiguobacterium sp. s7 TaxID=2751235 RepID=UPI001BE61326|nr:glycosyltransferase family 2 protein [Exiguobacterium sp. s7]
MIKLSICIPVYNDHHDLKALLLKLKQQIKENNYECYSEIIIVDDGSESETKQNLEKIKSELEMKNFNLLYNSHNIGLLKTRNKLIENSFGSHIVFIDSGDTIKQSYIFEIKNAIEEMVATNSSIAIFGMEIKKPYTNKIDEILKNHEKTIKKSNEGLLDYSKQVHFKSHTVTKIINKKMYEDEELYFDENQNGKFEDARHVFKWIGSATNILYIPEVLYVYIKQSSSLSSINNHDLKKEHDLLQAFQIFNNYIENLNLTYDLKMKILSFYKINTYIDLAHLFKSSECEIYEKQVNGFRKKIHLKDYCTFYMDSEIKFRRKMQLGYHWYKSVKHTLHMKRIK